MSIFYAFIKKYGAWHIMKERYFFNLIIKNIHSEKIETYSFCIHLTHFREKTHLLALELIFVSSCLRVYMYIKVDIQNKRLESHKKRSLFAKWAIQNI